MYFRYVLAFTVSLNLPDRFLHLFVRIWEYIGWSCTFNPVVLYFGCVAQGNLFTKKPCHRSKDKSQNALKCHIYPKLDTGHKFLIVCREKGLVTGHLHCSTCIWLVKNDFKMTGFKMTCLIRSWSMTSLAVTPCPLSWFAGSRIVNFIPDGTVFA